MTKYLTIALTALVGICSEAAESSQPTYAEPFRPQFHFSPAKNWMNDPNGMFFYDGEYHLFYQYNPFGDKWGHMSWGHAVSPDLVHWTHLPVALAEENDVMIFSGSAVVDWNNTSGFGKEGKPPLIAIYTGHYTKKPLQNQQIAYSNDRGRTWIKYEGNPVLDIGEKDFRDPKVMWHAPTKRWIMTVAWPVERKVRFYSSPNLKEWQHLSDFGPAGSVSGIWECPDLFPLPVKRGDDRWVLIVNVGSGAVAGGSGCQYFIGSFDGERFTLDPSYPKPQNEFIPDGKLLADFENGYSGWEITGDAFGNAPARGTLANQQPVAAFLGNSLVNTYHNGDQTRGNLVSPEFEVTHDHLSFLIGGGNHPGRTGICLLVDGRTVRISTGDNAERLSWKSWNVSEFRGRKARVEIFDQETGGWGHINVDHIILADLPAHGPSEVALWADYGPDFCAAVSWSDIPKRDGRRVWLGWMSNWQWANDVPTAPWRNAMSLPREVSLVSTREGLRMVQTPVDELQKIRGRKLQKRNATISEINEWLAENNVAGASWELEIELSGRKLPGETSLELFSAENQKTLLRYDVEKKMLSLDRVRSGRVDFHERFADVYSAPLKTSGDELKLRVFVDSCSVEVFANDGQTVISALVFPKDSKQPFRFSGPDSESKINRVTAWKLKPAVPILEETAAKRK